MKRIEDDDGCQWPGDDPFEGEEDEEKVRQGEKNQAGGEGASPAEDHRVGSHRIEDVALVVADLLRQVAGGEGQAKEGGQGEAATVDRPSQGISKKEMEGAAGQMGYGAQERLALPIESRQGVEGT